MTLDGIEYTVDTPTDNALNLLNYINQYCIDKGLKDSDGNVLQFVVNITSPIWLIILGLGYMFNIFQRLLYACGLSFNISSCPDSQILNLMEIAGTKYLEGTSTIVTVNVTAGPDGDCVVAKTDSITYKYEGVDVVFYPVYEVTIPAGMTGSVTTKSDIIGAMYIPAGAFTSFDVAPTNFASMTSLVSLPGSEPETPAEARVRLQQGVNVASGLDACISALRSLPGIQTVNLFFNTSLVSDLVIPGLTIPPRCCGMVVQGYSEDIANTYFDYLDVPCVGGSLTQNYVTLAGQILPVTYNLPEQAALYIRVNVRIPNNLIVPEGYQAAIIALLMPASASLLIGENYTQMYLLNYLIPFSVTGMSIIGVEVSTDGINYADTTNIQKNQICSIIADNVSFVETV